LQEITMARRPRAARLETRTARLKLKFRKKPYDFTSISAGIQLGYRRCKDAGRWVVKVADGHGSYWTKRVAYADDHENADGEHILTWWQAQDKARALARGKDAGGRPATVAEALADYEADLIARSGSPANARRVRTLLPSTMLAKPVALLTARELKHLRDGLVAKGAKPSSVNRDLKGFKAALNLAAAHDERITNARTWRTGLAALPDAHTARNVILDDGQVLTLIAAAYAENDTLGLLVETTAICGTRISQLARLEVADLQADRHDPRLMMPSSRKGRGHKKITRRPVPITADLADKLKRAAGNRAPTDPLLLRSDGKPWRPENQDYWLPFRNTVTRAGLDPKIVTLYALRHSSIVRALLAGVPARVVAVQHDTSVGMLERTYSAFIADHSDAVGRRGLLNTAPAAANVVPLAKGR
jgi:site-specific recombinase XerD